MKVLSVVGNRPQFIKSAPLSLALREAGIEEVSLHTGQHYDPELSQVFYDELGLPEPAYRLDARSREVASMRPGIAAALGRERPELALVFGDTNSTLAGARAAVEAAVPLAHVEAGMRSGDLSMPEEQTRIEVDGVAELLFCPDERSAELLRNEAVQGRIEVVGDVMADACLRFAPIALQRSTAPEQPYLLLTLHREANLEQARLRRLLSEIDGLDWTVVFPAHPGTRKAIERAGIRPAPGVRMTEPVGYLEMLALVARAHAVVTDSGGLQKEAYWLGVPCVTLRPSTEWIDTVEAGANALVDPADPRALGPAVANAAMPAERPVLYGDGHASERIASVLCSVLAA